MTTGATGADGERAAETLFRYDGWDIIERQPSVAGHRMDLLIKHPMHGEALVEVKVWTSPTSGRDTVLKAVAVAYDLRLCGEERPIFLVLSEELMGLYGGQVLRARDAGTFDRILILGLRELT